MLSNQYQFQVTEQVPTTGVGDFEVGIVVGRTGPVEEVGVGVELAAGVALAHVDHLLRGEAGLAVCGDADTPL